MKTLTPTAEIETKEDGTFSVWAIWQGVNRPRTSGISCGKNRMLAERLQIAINAGKVWENPKVKTDIHGDTYVQASNALYTRHLNKELTRIGF